MSTSHSTYSPAGKSCVMEPQGWVPDESWSSFDLTMAAEESEAMAHLFGAHQYLNEQDHNNSGIATQQMFWDHQGADNSYYSSEDANCNPYVESQGNCSDGPTGDSSDFLHTFSDVGGYYMDNAGVNFSTADEQATRTSSMPPFPFDSCHSFTGAAMNEVETNSDEVARSMEPIRHVPADHSWQSVKRMLHDDHAEKPGTQAEGDDNQLGGPKKKARRASVQVSKKGKNVQSKRQPKCASVCNDADSNADMNAPSSSCYSSEDDDSSALQDPRGAGSKNGGKPRADRGSATDPQSLYARKRRERINERLRILQNLVPNGTKVDISTMLEEAVKYVKFLQLQIKLLSSDEMWMYAPIAYNGMNLGFDLKIPAPSQLPKGVDAAVGKKR